MVITWRPYFLLVIIVHLISCGYTSYTIRNNFQFTDYTEQSNTIILTQIIDTVVDEFGIDTTDENWRIVLTKEYIAGYLPSGSVAICDGFTDTQRRIIYVTYYPCLADTALIHELVHAFFLDRNHADINLWKKVKKLQRSLIQQTCSSSYTRPAPKRLKLEYENLPGM